MESENKYIGDDKFKKFLEHYKCPSDLGVVKMKFAGAICSPNLELRPTDVISSLWEQQKQPRLETKTEAELFFKFFMGLWDEIFDQVHCNKFLLPKLGKKIKNDLKMWCRQRYNEIEFGFLEGFWGGKSDLKLNAYIAQIIDSLSEMADIYSLLEKKIAGGNHGDEIRKAIEHTDKTMQRSIEFIIENSVLPRIEQLQHTTN